ncbi:MAG: 50S ribosomal protein L23 [Patescibacteria group bacterium]
MSDPSVIKKVFVTERSTDLNTIGKYVFIVKPSATKPEVKKAIREIYGVRATAVNIVNRPPKTKRFRGRAGVQQGYKKAIVTLAAGEKIDIAK